MSKIGMWLKLEVSLSGTGSRCTECIDPVGHVCLPNFDGNNLLIAAVLLLLAVVLGLILTGKLGLWKGEQKWGWLRMLGL